LICTTSRDTIPLSHYSYKEIAKFHLVQHGGGGIKGMTLEKAVLISRLAGEIDSYDFRGFGIYTLPKFLGKIYI
jgi:hypothetical protein